MTVRTVLIADDSPTARALLRRILDTDPRLAVVGSARDGEEAIHLTQRLRPSIVVMDIQMPGVDGIEATGRIMASHPTPIIVITAGYDADRVGISLQAVGAGALTVLPKPAGPASDSFHADAAQLVRLVVALADVKVVRQRQRQRHRAASSPPITSVPPRDPHTRQLGVVGIAASTGGPAALQRMLSLLPASFGAPILVVQHIADGFVSGLATWLRPTTPLDVQVAIDGRPAQPGTVYLAPDDHHLGMSDGHLHLSSAPPVGGFRPSGDMLFRSLADAHGSETCGVVLTGMGKDGLDGAAQIHAAGGLVLAQDEESSAVWGMPGVVVAAGLAHLVGPVESLATKLTTAAARQGDPR